MLNYCTHALEQITPLLTPDFKLQSPGDSVFLEELAGLMGKSVKFELPPNALIVDHEKSAEIIEADLLHLPFPVMALEYPYDIFSPNSVAGETTVPITKRIVICAEYEAVASTWLGRTAAQITPLLKEVGGVLLYPFFFYEGYWCPSTWGMAVPRTSDTSQLTRFKTGQKNKKFEVKLGATVVPALIEAADKQVREVGNETAQFRAFYDCAEEFYALINLLVALSCSNISLQNQPAPDKLNKKRIANGKLPFSDYMEVVVNIQDTGSVKEGGWSVEGRSSVRSHLRRGHIRRLPDGRRIWVQSTIVKPGAGTPVKQYKVKAGLHTNN